MFGLADCNNFFVSCERVFNPSLNGRPVIILSNNDGCVIARSNEAKRLGIKMGHPYFQLEALIKRHDVAVYSSNYALYSDMSKRVQQTLRSLCPATEVYSIDESFLNLNGIKEEDLDAFGHYVSYKVLLLYKLRLIHQSKPFPYLISIYNLNHQLLQNIQTLF